MKLRNRLNQEQLDFTPVKLNGAMQLNLQFFADEPDEPEDENGDEEDGEPKDKDVTMKQSEINKIMAREKRQGRNALLKQLGFKDEKEMKSAMDALKKFQDSQKLEKDKANETINNVNAEKAALEARVLKAEAKTTSQKV